MHINKPREYKSAFRINNLVAVSLGQATAHVGNNISVYYYIKDVIGSACEINYSSVFYQNSPIMIHPRFQLR